MPEVWQQRHSYDKCLHLCATCGEIHESGECLIDKFYNVIRKWHVLSKHAEIFTRKVEEMLYEDSRQIYIWYEPSVRGYLLRHFLIRRRVQEFNDAIYLIANSRGGSTFVSSISSVKRVDNYTRSPAKTELDLALEESRGY